MNLVNLMAKYCNTHKTSTVIFLFNGTQRHYYNKLAKQEIFNFEKVKILIYFTIFNIFIIPYNNF